MNKDPTVEEIAHKAKHKIRSNVCCLHRIHCSERCTGVCRNIHALVFVSDACDKISTSNSCNCKTWYTVVYTGHGKVI